MCFQVRTPIHITNFICVFRSSVRVQDLGFFGLKSAGASFSRRLADCMRTLGYTSCKADPDLWFKPMVRPDDGFKYYAYVLLYVDNCLCIHHDATSTLLKIDKYFPMKKDSIGDPDIYLGAKLRKVTLQNGVHCWAQSSSKYIQDLLLNLSSSGNIYQS